MQVAALKDKRKIWTDEELETLPRDGHKYELLDGNLIRNPIYAGHGKTCVCLGALLHHFANTRKLGRVYDSSTGFRLSDDLLLCPDIAFVSKARLKTVEVAPEKFL